MAYDTSKIIREQLKKFDDELMNGVPRYDENHREIVPTGIVNASILKKVNIDLKDGFGHIYVNGAEVFGVAKLELESNPGEPPKVILTLIPKEVEVNIDGAEIETIEAGGNRSGEADSGLPPVPSKIDE